jgi:hypothetical protein
VGRRHIVEFVEVHRHLHRTVAYGNALSTTHSSTRITSKNGITYIDISFQPRCCHPPISIESFPVVSPAFVTAKGHSFKRTSVFPTNIDAHLSRSSFIACGNIFRVGLSSGDFVL